MGCGDMKDAFTRGPLEPTGPVDPHEDGSNWTIRREPKRLRSRTSCSSSAAGMRATTTTSAPPVDDRAKRSITRR